jgi:hypothetical protein
VHLQLVAARRGIEFNVLFRDFDFEVEQAKAQTKRMPVRHLEEREVRNASERIGRANPKLANKLGRAILSNSLDGHSVHRTVDRS